MTEKHIEENLLQTSENDLHNVDNIKTVSDVLLKIRGTQKYQKIFSFLLIMVFTSGNRFMTLYPFLQLYPGLKCQDPVTQAFTVDCKQP